MNRRALGRGVLIVSWLSAAAAIIGFVLPWASLEVNAHKLTGTVEQLTGRLPLNELAQHVRAKVGRVVVEVQHGAKTVTGTLSDLATIPSRVSGIEIPRLAQREDAQVVLALAEVLTGERQLGMKSYAVYLVPGLAVLCAVGLTIAKGARQACWLIGFLCVALAGVGCWKLLTTKTDTALVAIAIGPGLWVSLWAYLGLGLAAIALGVLGGRRGSSRDGNTLR